MFVPVVDSYIRFIFWKIRFLRRNILNVKLLILILNSIHCKEIASSPSLPPYFKKDLINCKKKSLTIHTSFSRYYQRMK